MKLKGLVEYDLSNYKVPSMFLIFPKCTFKCDKECGQPVCQNSALAREPVIEIDAMEVVQRYLDNPLTHAVVCGGLEPFDSTEDLGYFLGLFRAFSSDPIVIYTGYTEKESELIVSWLVSKFGNIIVKFGRFIPNSPHIYDAVLGVELASNNQYAKAYQESVGSEYSTTNCGEDKDVKHD